MRGRPALLVLALALVPAVALADIGGGSSGDTRISAGSSPQYFGQAIAVEAYVEQPAAVPVVLEADAFPYDGVWQEIGRGSTDPQTKAFRVRQRPDASTKYRVTNLDNGYQAEAEVPLQLLLKKRSTCPKSTSDPRRFNCEMRADVRAPGRFVGRRVQLTVFNAGGRRVHRVTRRLRRLEGSLLRARLRYRASYRDGVKLCLLDVAGDGFQRRFRDTTQNCDFMLG